MFKSFYNNLELQNKTFRPFYILGMIDLVCKRGSNDKPLKMFNVYLVDTITGGGSSEE